MYLIKYEVAFYFKGFSTKLLLSSYIGLLRSNELDTSFASLRSPTPGKEMTIINEMRVRDLPGRPSSTYPTPMKRQNERMGGKGSVFLI